MERVYTYNASQIKIALGNHVVSGVAEDSFVSVEPAGEGVLSKVGAYGEVNRAITNNNMYNVRIVLLQNSPSNKWLQAMYKKDQADGSGIFPILIKDLMGYEKFSGAQAWVVNDAVKGYGRESTNREWVIAVAIGETSE